MFFTKYDFVKMTYPYITFMRGKNPFIYLFFFYQNKKCTVCSLCANKQK